MRTHLLLIMASLCAALSVMAQTRQISGAVTDAQNGTPMSGVTVSGPDKISAQTGTDGRFTITVPAGRVSLLFTYVGYEPETVTVSANSTTVAITMEVKSGSMNEVVVTALG